MGSCIMKPQKVVPQVHKLKFSERISLHIKKNSQYLRADIQEEIFRAKDEKVPQLDLGKNLLYMERMKHSTEVH